MINKFPVYRPQLLITTREVRSQMDNLDMSDLEAVMSVLKELYSESVHMPGRNIPDWMVIYNCGRNSGNSQPHKHIQVFPIPETSGGQDIELFPDTEGIREHLTQISLPEDTTSSALDTHLAGDAESSPSQHNAQHLPVYADQRLPFVHFLSYFEHSNSFAHTSTSLSGAPSRVPPTLSLLRTYDALLSHVKRSLHLARINGIPSYNLVMTTRWMLLVPRRAAYGEGTGSARAGPQVNSMGMMGFVWISHLREKEEWLRRGIDRHLADCGVRWEDIGVERRR